LPLVCTRWCLHQFRDVPLLSPHTVHEAGIPMQPPDRTCRSAIVQDPNTVVRPGASVTNSRQLVIPLMHCQ